MLCKAGCTRCKVCSVFLTSGIAVVKSIIKKIGLRWHLAEWHRNVELMPRYLSPDQAILLQRHCDGTVGFYLKLASMALESAELLFPSRPKIHVTQWLIIDIKFCN